MLRSLINFLDDHPVFTMLFFLSLVWVSLYVNLPGPKVVHIQKMYGMTLEAQSVDVGMSFKFTLRDDGYQDIEALAHETFAEVIRKHIVTDLLISPDLVKSEFRNELSTRLAKDGATLVSLKIGYFHYPDLRLQQTSK